MTPHNNLQLNSTELQQSAEARQVAVLQHHIKESERLFKPYNDRLQQLGDELAKLQKEAARLEHRAKNGSWMEKPNAKKRLKEVLKKIETNRVLTNEVLKLRAGVSYVPSEPAAPSTELSSLFE